MWTALKKKTLMGILVGLLAFSLNSCVYLVVGSVGAVGGYVISPDTVEGIVSDRSQSDVWSRAIEVVSLLGVISERNDAAGVLIAKIQGARVTITVVRESEATVKLTIKARKSFLPKVKIAQDVYFKIANPSNL